MRGPGFVATANGWLRRLRAPLELSTPQTVAVWEEEPEFQAIVTASEGFSLLDRRRLHVLYDCVRWTREVPGEVAEAGVAGGGTAVLIGRTLASPGDGRRLHLFDSFQGLPPPTTAEDGGFHRAGEFGHSEATVRSVLDRAHVTNFETHAGWFHDTLPAFSGPGHRWSFVHLDADLYESVMTALRAFYPRLSPGGLLLLDDYGFPDTPGARKAAREFLATVPARLLYVPTGQAILGKPGSDLPPT